MIKCDHCGRVVPVAPHHFNVASPHVTIECVGYNTDAVAVIGVPCTGNEKRTWFRALQHVVLGDDSYWEGL